MDVIIILFTRMTVIDLMIFVIGILNIAVFYRSAKKESNLLYAHFNRTDSVSPLQDVQKKNLREVTAKETFLSASELLKHREQMNKAYSTYTIITTMFPLLGMLGTVMSLIPMVSSIGAEDFHLFFAALTSTFWGIVFAIICKTLDTLISYKIDDNEKHIEYLLNPKRNRHEEG